MVPPGIVMDSLIARKIWRVLVVNDTDSGESYMVGEDDHSKVPVPKYSTDIDQAHKIVEYFQNKGWLFRVQNVPVDNQFRACFFKNDSRAYRFVQADTMPMAICEAALAVLSGANLAHK